ncbi:MAG: hypothetical protein WBE94_25640, partial [Pseudolabrys sp.]
RQQHAPQSHLSATDRIDGRNRTDALGDFDPDRFLGERAPASSEYSPLGMSRIACLGEQLTLTIGRILLTTLANHFDLTPTADGPREYGGFHWQPSSRFRFRLTPRPGVATASMTDSCVDRA